jgi:hypothetical protein
VLAALSGCKNGTVPDPNDPNDVGALQPEVLRSDLKYASESLWERCLNKEITEGQFQSLMAQYANQLIGQMHIEKVPPKKAWEYGEVFRTAKRWKQAEIFYRIAVKAAPNQDRFVNDSLHLAEAMAHQNEVAEAIPIVKATFNSKPQEKAPILPGTLLEFVPAARGKGQDVELAKLLEGAIQQEEQTIVDLKSEAGQSFQMAKRHHITNAWKTIIDLYTGVGKRDLADAASVRAEKDLNSPAAS